MPVDSSPHSSADLLNELDPLSRALLDLSLQRGMEDAEIAEVLGTDEQAVLEVRLGLLRSLAEKLAPEHADADLPELQAVVAERLYAEQPETEEPAVEADDWGDEVDEAELEQAPTEVEDDRPTAVHKRPRALPAAPDEPEPGPAAPGARPPAERERRSALAFLLPLLLVAAVVALVVALTGGGDDQGESPGPAADKPPAEVPDRARPVVMTAVGGGDARGTARLDGDRLELKLRGLPQPNGGRYEIWLYDSVIDAQSLGSSKDSNIELDARVGGDIRDYEFVDVSLEPADGNPNHSGQSVLRVPVDKLVRASR